jgi:hypothetical protein
VSNSFSFFLSYSLSLSLSIYFCLSLSLFLSLSLSLSPPLPLPYGRKKFNSNKFNTCGGGLKKPENVFLLTFGDWTFIK